MLSASFSGPWIHRTLAVFVLSIHSILNVACKTLTRWPVVSRRFSFDLFLCFHRAANYFYTYTYIRIYYNSLDNADVVWNGRPPSGFCVMSVERYWNRSEICPGLENTDFSMRVTEGSCSFSFTDSRSLQHAFTLISSHLWEVMLWLLLCKDLEYICAPKPKGACGSSKGCTRRHDFHVMFCAACFKCVIWSFFDPSRELGLQKA